MRDEGQRDYLLSEQRVSTLKSQLRGGIASPENIALLSGLSLREREEFSRRSGTMVLYLGDEVARIVAAEEAGALRAAPAGHELRNLIALNIGCGKRTISPYLLPVDIMRDNINGTARGEHAELTTNAFLARPDDLPFRPATIDMIVALHMLEHIFNPVEVVNHWLDIVKPGGGIGIVLPDWRYTWNSRNDSEPFSHKWNPTPQLIEMMYHKHWSRRATLESFCTYDMRLSFDFVLRKRGKFAPFAAPPAASMKSGKQLAEEGIFLDEDSFKPSPLQRLMRSLRLRAREVPWLRRTYHAIRH